MTKPHKTSADDIPPSAHVRFAVWECHDKKCWMCARPLRLFDTVTEHVVPKSLLKNSPRLTQAKKDLGLPENFDVLGFENLLPSCVPCNLKKAKQVFRPSAVIQLHLERLAGKANAVRRAAEAVRGNIAIDQVLQAVFRALESNTMSMVDLENFLTQIIRVPERVGVPDDVIILGDGYWYKQSKIVYEGNCRCERKACLGSDEKVYCYFHVGLSDWVISSGLYHRCYDEIVKCPRCTEQHKRGHVGRIGLCSFPFTDQVARK